MSMTEFEHKLLEKIGTLNNVLFSIGAELRAMRQTYVEQKQFDDTTSESDIYTEAYSELERIITEMK